ncbi:DUF2920 family protein [Campylobacter hepaticus]|uniref:DUF2920 family protein n=1 Tax=Campylobacter hepaticus TaxID=1813019 RepID=A0A6A7JQT4_9BACT|nr:DUF2920 family protein [Campylobacter hepaticus]AXP08227.1 DUF2920 family protein [Campylobacter hepaticus]MPV54782.1 DUF2920 family protein [Campylobacter hepaticus]MPV61981.1 DUF2920 family protein [Campylobacter hepaticus]MPV78120.1 DUF2920 family protein [Campylobacter hepaticus]MPV79421.1 DUF2920 family protein [Campylobacter hepaticus]
MIVNDTYEIDSCDDVELGIKRESKLEFKLCFDDEKTPEALVFVVQGVGADCDDVYFKFVVEHLLKSFSVAFVGVNYHCIGNRPQTGSSFYLDDIDKLILKTSCEAIDIKLPYSVDKIQSYEQMSDIFRFINNKIIEGKQKGEFALNYFLNLHVSLQPKKNEYQNFGIMQAQDLLNVALYLKKHAPFDTKQGNIPVIMIGGSHGGYLVHLAAKIAPWFVDGVVDNSSAVKFLWRVVGFGKEIDFMQYSEFATFDFFNHIKTHCSSKTFWTSNASSPYFFSPARRKIRNILEQDHLIEQAKYLNTCFTSYHSLYDEYVSLEEKSVFYKELKKLGFDAKLHAFTKESQIDGKFIKNLNHGMGIPVKLLIKKELPLMLEKIKQKTKIEYKEKKVAYPCENLIYQFSEENDKISLKIDTL